MPTLLEREPKTIAPQEQNSESVEQQETPDDLAYITEEIRRMQEPELDSTEQRLDELKYVNALNTEIKTNKHFEPTTKEVMAFTLSHNKGEKKIATAREEIANQIELDTLNDPTIPNLQDAFRNPKDGILPLLNKRDMLIERGANDAAKKLQEKIVSAAKTITGELPDTPKGKQIKIFLEHITAEPMFSEEKKAEEKKVEEQPKRTKENPAPSLRKEFQRNIVTSLREVDMVAANILDNRLDAIKRMQTEEERKQALEQLKDTVRKRLEKKINWEQTEARIDHLGRLLAQEVARDTKGKDLQAAFAV